MRTHIAATNLRPGIVWWDEEVPTHIAATNLRPGIVWWDEEVHTHIALAEFRTFLLRHLQQLLELSRRERDLSEYQAALQKLLKAAILFLRTKTS